MLAFELGEESWQLGFSTGLGQQVLRLVRRQVYHCQ